jgi:hypothetical protein
MWDSYFSICGSFLGFLFLHTFLRWDSYFSIGCTYIIEVGAHIFRLFRHGAKRPREISNSGMPYNSLPYGEPESKICP